MEPYRPRTAVRYQPTLSVRLEPGLHRQVKMLAAANRTSMQKLISRWISEGVTRDELNAAAERIEVATGSLEQIRQRLRDDRT